MEEEEPMKETESGYRGRRITVGVERHTNPKKDKGLQALWMGTNKMSLDITISKEVTGDP